MQLTDFIKEYRQEIDDTVVKEFGDNCNPKNDEDRREWVTKFAPLYIWARCEGVPI